MFMPECEVYIGTFTVFARSLFVSKSLAIFGVYMYVVYVLKVQTREIYCMVTTEQLNYTATSRSCHRMGQQWYKGAVW